MFHMEAQFGAAKLEKNMATKIEMEYELLMVEHDVRHNANNMNAFNFRATLCANAAAKAENVVSASFYANRKAEAENRADHLRNLIADAA
ncbi:hypothetical protein RCH05_003616 [Janthinobacterium sp. CAN_S7]